MHELLRRDVLYSSRGLNKLDMQRLSVKLLLSTGLSKHGMQRLSVKLQLACGERSFDELHLQRRINGGEWRLVHSVRGRKVQGVGRSCHLPRLSVKLQLAYGELSFDKLRVETCIFIWLKKYSSVYFLC